MADSPAPLLAYNRIDANRRNTRVLVAAFALLVMPFAWLALRSLRFDSPIWILAACSAALSVAFTAIVAYLGPLFWRAVIGGQWSLADTAREPQLHRMLENLCIAAGLPVPHLYIMESSAPNAFTVAYGTSDVSLVVTRGLLKLLDSREQQAVLAHELSHIGNHDTTLSMELAALLAVTRAPLDACRAIARWASLVQELGSWTAGLGVGILALIASSVFLLAAAAVLVTETVRGMVHHASSLNLPVRMMVLVHMFMIAPAAALWLRKGVSQERELLADADAVLLTRDPEGLALALAKVAAASGTPVHAGTATAHLFFVDPLAAGTSGRGMFPSHPPVDARVAALARMGDGIIEGLVNASEAGLDYRGRMLLNEVVPSTPLEPGYEPPGTAPQYFEPGTVLWVADATPLYGSRDRRSNVSVQLPAGAMVVVQEADRGFYEARTQDGTRGYLDCRAGLQRQKPDAHDHRPAFTLSCVAGSAFRLTDLVTPLYEKPDGWAAVLHELPAGQIVTFTRMEGNFAHVETGWGGGYIASTTGAEAIGTIQSAGRTP